MNLRQFNEDLAALFRADPDFSFAHPCTANDSASYKLPALVCSAVFTPFDHAGNAGRIAITVEVRGTASDGHSKGGGNADLEHATRVEQVREKLLGPGKAATLGVLAGTGRWNIPGWTAGEDEDGQAGSHFETPVRLAGTIVAL